MYFFISKVKISLEMVKFPGNDLAKVPIFPHHDPKPTVLSLTANYLHESRSGWLLNPPQPIYSVEYTIHSHTERLTCPATIVVTWCAPWPSMREVLYSIPGPTNTLWHGCISFSPSSSFLLFSHLSLPPPWRVGCKGSLLN